VDHLVLRLDPDHLGALDQLVDRALTAAGIERTLQQTEPHITLVAHLGLSPDEVVSAVGPVIAATSPFTVHAHGYGFFTGTEPSDLNLHIPVVRGERIDALHRGLCAALAAAGADIARWTSPERWSPHITLLDHDLDPAALGRAAAWLAMRHHPTWNMGVDRVALIGGRRDPPRAPIELPLLPAPPGAQDLAPARSM
jgi:2'-5' RNA ligase